MQSFLAENNGTHIHHAIETTKCEKHKADMGTACWLLPHSKMSDVIHRGICGRRALAAGYNGRISPESIRSMAPSRKNPSGEQKPFKKNARSFVTNSK